MSDQRPTANTEQRARDQALRLLAVRSRTREELRRRLLVKGHPANRVAAVLDRLEESGLIDDGRFALERARALGGSRGFGPRKLRDDLLCRGVAAELVERAIDRVYDENTPEETMRRLLRQKFGATLFEPEADRKLLARAYRFLIGRGFEPEQVQELFGDRLD